MTNVRIGVVVPTRNRLSLAMEAVRSLVDQGRDVQLFVSDNSPSPDLALADFVRDLGRPSIRYLRPPTSLRQAAHWDWATREAMRISDATHFTVHYDRKVSRPDAIATLQSAAARWPETVICWPHDFVSDIPPPLRLWQPEWTGKVYSLRTSRFVELTARGRASAINSHALPLSSNCLVPRAILEEVIGRFGTLCDSTTPDSCFAFRFAAIRELYLHLDRPLGIVYAADRSAGGGYSRGKGGDWLDLQRSWGDRPWLSAAPIPGLNLGLNMLYHEYELVRREVGESLPPIDFNAYLVDLSNGLELVDDSDARAAFRRLLEERGWNGGRRARPVRDFIRRRLLAPLEQSLGLRLPGSTGRAFRDDAEALRYALANPRPPSGDSSHLDLLAPVEVGTAQGIENQAESCDQSRP